MRTEKLCLNHFATRHAFPEGLMTYGRRIGGPALHSGYRIPAMHDWEIYSRSGEALLDAWRHPVTLDVRMGNSLLARRDPGRRWKVPKSVGWSSRQGASWRGGPNGPRFVLRVRTRGAVSRSRALCFRAIGWSRVSHRRYPGRVDG